MASKGQKFTHYSQEFKRQVVNDYLNNQGGVHTLSKVYGISWQTISTWVYTYKKQGNIENRNCLKGRKKDENIDYKERFEILKKYQAFLKAQRERK